MHVYVAIVPPHEVLEELRAVVANVHPDGTVGDRREPAGRSGSHRRETGRFKLRRGRDERRAPTGHHDQLDMLPVERMMLPVAPFGNLTRADADRVVETLAAEATAWHRPELRFSGGGALEWPGDTGVWARIAGDVDGLQIVGRSVPRVAQRLSLFVDRRIFRPWQQVGTITDNTSAAYLESVVAELDRFTGTPWVQEHVTLFRGQSDNGLGYEESVLLPLAP